MGCRTSTQIRCVMRRARCRRYRRQCAFLHVALGDIVFRCLPSAVTMRRKSPCCSARHFGVTMALARREIAGRACAGAPVARR